MGDTTLEACGSRGGGWEVEEEAGNNDGNSDRWHVKEAHQKRLATFEVALKY